MARYSATLKLTPSEVIKRAEEHFGVLSGGMNVTSKTDSSLCLESSGGYVTISMCPGAGKKNEMEIETDHFDEQVVEFLRSI